MIRACLVIRGLNRPDLNKMAPSDSRKLPDGECQGFDF